MRGNAGLLARPHLRAPVRAERFDARLLLQLQIEQHAAAVYPQAPGRGVLRLRAGRPWSSSTSPRRGSIRVRSRISFSSRMYSAQNDCRAGPICTSAAHAISSSQNTAT